MLVSFPAQVKQGRAWERGYVHTLCGAQISSPYLLQVVLHHLETSGNERDKVKFTWSDKHGQTLVVGHTYLL